MFKFINAEMTPKKRERIILELFDFVCHVCCVFDENWTFFYVKNWCLRTI